jgi:hypothetical protein
VLGRESTVEILGMRRVGPYATWKERQIASLPTIARLACDGTIRLFDYGELELETMKGTIVGGVVVHLLAKVPLFHAKSPVERSRFQQMEIDQFANKNTFISFCKGLLSLNLVEAEKNPGLCKMIPSLQSI